MGSGYESHVVLTWEDGRRVAVFRGRASECREWIATRKLHMTHWVDRA